LHLSSIVVAVWIGIWIGAVAPHESAAQPPAPGKAQDDGLRLDTFDKSFPPGETPPNWEAKKFFPIFGSGERYFYEFVHNGPGEHYLHLRSGRNNSFTVIYTKSTDIKDLNRIEWDWKIAVLPKGGDVRRKERDDQAGSLCLVVDPGTASFDSSLCYLFENDGPKDTPITSTHADNARYLILRTAKSGDPVGEWLHESRNILEDYKRVFGRDPGKPAFLGMQIDSNDTESSAEAFYRNLILHKS
jgi:hypothetical protein